MRLLAARPLAFVLAAMLVLVGCTNGEGSVSDDVAATVDGVEISREQVENNVRLVVDRDHGGYDGLSAEERAEIVGPLERTVLSLLIQTQLIAAVARAQGVDIDQADVDARYDADIEQAGGEDAFAAQLAGTMLTLELYRVVVLPTDMRLEAAQNALLADQPPVELRTARHILVETESEADAIVTELDEGADFAQIAMERSIDTGSGSSGGDLGPSPRGVYVPEFEAAVWDAAMNTVVGPIQTQFGFHIIEVTGTSTRDVSELTQQDIDQLVGEDLFALITDVLESADVTIAPGIGEWDPVAASVVAPSSVG
ncbi:MAG: peptidylprolyl isomerase [Nitriliruptoraceae bacterium]